MKIQQIFENFQAQLQLQLQLLLELRLALIPINPTTTHLTKKVFLVALLNNKTLNLNPNLNLNSNLNLN